MKLNKLMADKIVKRTMEVTQLNINVMNRDGIIISSSNPARIATIHEAAQQVIKSGEEIVLSTQESKKWSGTRPGINMPIFFEQEIVGVIGISGSPQEVVPFGKAVRMMTEMMLQQAYLTEQMALEERSLNFLVQDMISGTLDSSPEVVQSRGKLLGLDLSGPRSIVIVRTSGKNDWTARSSSTKQWQSKMAACFQYADQVCVSAVNHNRWIIVTDLRKLYGPQKIKRYLYECAEKLLALFQPLSQEKLLVTMGHGYAELSLLQQSFQEAQQTLYVLERFPEKGSICHYDDAALEILLLETKDESRRRVIEEVLGALVKHDELIETLQVLFSSDHNLTLASQRLNIHRNTLLYRLERIERISGLQPRHFADAFKIQLALELLRFH
ncbi:CdaR family transcriptional regulator [Brevibacillus sp. 179-C9.3 HS]|uniref:CdaR family transcriptional regulator n=1 Tax=unclassified Brevibacillus TaxID=2684853 RepID=UPI0039A0557D